MIWLGRERNIWQEETGFIPFFGWGFSKVRGGCGLLLSLSDLSAFALISCSGFLLLRPIRTHATTATVQIPHESQADAAAACNPSTGESETGNS